MAKLIFKRFKCQVDTSEMGSESPYFLTWVGNVKTNQSMLKYTRKAFWENKVDPGPWWPVNDTVVSDFDLSPAKTLALAIMIEEDEAVDLTSSEAADNVQGNAITSVREKMASLLNVHFSNESDIQAANVVSNFRATFEGEVKKFLANPSGAQDDLMKPDGGLAARVIHIHNAPGTLDIVKFRDDGDGEYWGEYAVA